MRKTNLILEPADLLEFEEYIASYLKRFINFKKHSLYFPNSGEKPEIVFIAAENRLLLPLIWKDKPLGMLMLEGSRARETKRVMPFLENILHTGLELIALKRSGERDSITGMASEESFFMRIENDAQELQDLLADPSRSQHPLYKLCLGMIVIAWYDGHQFGNEFDYDLCEQVYVEIGKTILAELPEGAFAAPLGRFEGRYEFGILFNASGRGACLKLTRKILEKAEALCFKDDPSGRNISIRLYAGQALYPQDMRGDEFQLPILEQALRLRDRARFAARAAKNAGIAALPERILSFARILQKEGRITKILDNGKFLINLGQAANASEGMRFLVLGHRADNGKIFIKCQIILLETRIKESVAEIFYMEEAGEFPEVGDHLLLANAANHRKELFADAEKANINLILKDSSTQFLSHAEFLVAFAKARKECSKFTLAICQLKLPTHKENAGEIWQNFYKLLNNYLEKIKQDKIMPELAGRYGGSSLIFFHRAQAEACLDFYKEFTRIAEELECACGLFSHPFLNFSKSASEECALKALEYALLLPKPHIGIFDSLALNISADKKFSLGDTFGAIEEYQNVILADPANAMAKNSLGVCLATLGKTEEAEKLFDESLRIADDNQLKAKIYYNRGALYHKTGELKKAKNNFCRCIRMDKHYIFAWLKMGQIAEHTNHKKVASAFYRQALKLAPRNSDLANVAQRHLARAELNISGIKTAKAMLYENLQRNPNDAQALSMLAKIYLEDDKDAALAEMLARRSVNLQDSADAWQILANALAAQGKIEESAKAQTRADRKTI